ncbi:MAG: hypothetical protein KIS85_07420 [Anaerolineales bacterium]|nr:hypothetical protein [Anaerolineales bacterium]
MNDTQWPRYEVFQQEAEGKPVLHNGTVHAADIELALLNARSVFARRPDATQMWVAPAEQITSRTREELAADPPAAEAAGAAEAYYIFGKLAEQAQASLLGEVGAASGEAAVAAALAQFGAEAALRWWAVPAAAVLKSDPADAGPMFAPAREKTYKDQAEYPVVTMMRQLRAKANTNHKDTENTK